MHLLVISVILMGGVNQIGLAISGLNKRIYFGESWGYLVFNLTDPEVRTRPILFWFSALHHRTNSSASVFAYFPILFHLYVSGAMKRFGISVTQLHDLRV